MPDLIASYVEQQGFVMMDGGLATELERRGADLSHFLWSAKVLAEAPGLVEEVHRDYLEAGADIIASATYQASFDGFRRAGFGRERAAQLMRLGVDLALRARDAFWSLPANREGRLRPLVAASVGPYGACLADGSEYHGNYGVDAAELAAFHRPRLDLLAATAADLLAFETIPSRLEAEVLVDLVRDHPDRVAWLSFSCRDGAHVSHGERFADCAALADGSEQIVAVGVNCTAPQHVPSLLESAPRLRTPLAVYPNSGEHWIAAERRWSGPECGAFPVREWYRLGARLIGGCCRTGPDDIRSMRAELLQLGSPS